MNENIRQKWIAALAEFAKKPSYCQLRFPMKMASVGGELYSALGILCEIHAQETNSEWDIFVPIVFDYEEDEEKPKKKTKAKPKKEYEKVKKLPNISGYKGSKHVPPDEVLKWAEMAPAECSVISRITAEDGFDGVIQYLKNKSSDLAVK